MHTGSRAFFVLMALAATGTEVASAANNGPVHYRLEAIAVTAPPTATAKISSAAFGGYYADNVVEDVMDAPGVKAVWFPVVDSVEKVPNLVDLSSDIALPHQAKQRLGSVLSATLLPGGNSVDLSYRRVEFLGFTDKKANQPIFSHRSVSTKLALSYQIPSGFYCVNLGASGTASAVYDADGRRKASGADANERQLLFVKITRG